MSAIFHLPGIGQVSIEDEILYYDEPVLYTIRSENGGRFLGFRAFETSADTVHWYSSISNQEYKSLLSGQTELRSLFSDREQVLEAHRNHTTAEFTKGNWIRPDALNAKMLPRDGYRLDADEAELELSDGSLETAHALALRLHRAVARLIFDFGKGVYEGPATAIALAIVQTQKTVDAIAHSKAQNAKDKGAVPIAITSRTALNLRPAIAGSVGIELVANVEADMWDDSLAGQCLQELLDLLRSRSNQDELRARFAPLSARAADAYRSLLKSLAKSGADVSIEAGLSDQGIIAKFSHKDLEEMVQAMETVDRQKSHEIKIEAILVAYDSDSRKFKMRDLAGDQRYNGTATGAAVDFAAHARINDSYRAHILERIEYDTVTDEPSTRYELVELTSVGR